MLKLGELPTPAPGPGEVRVRVMVSGVNPSDAKTRAGLRGPQMPFPRVVPHCDGAGIIDAIGEGVHKAREGQRVWLFNAAWGRAEGTAAQYVTLPGELAVPLPDSVDFAVGACLGVPALTAYHSVCSAGGVAGQNVLITGGAGAVGHYAIQIAKFKGAGRVIATVSSAEKGALAKFAGADAVVDYRSEDVVAACKEATDGEGIDRIIDVDVSANIATDLAVIRPGGRIVAYGSNTPEVSVPFVPAIMAAATVQFFMVYKLSKDDRMDAIADLTAWLGTGRMQHNIAARLPLADIVEAHEAVESGRLLGQIILEIDQGD